MTENVPLSDADRWLAAEYALGVLEPQEMHAAAARLERDLAFREDVNRWNDMFVPMLDDVESADPPDRVWRAIESELGLSAKGDARVETGKRDAGLWSSLVFWRGLSFGSLGLAGACLAALLVVAVWQPARDLPLVAALNAAGDGPAFTAQYDPASGAMLIRAANRSETPTLEPELWLIPGDGVPRSLGLIGHGGAAHVTVPDSYRPDILDGSVLAISLEPAGGSPTGQPTGPVVASGKLLSF